MSVGVGISTGDTEDELIVVQTFEEKMAIRNKKRVTLEEEIMV